MTVPTIPPRPSRAQNTAASTGSNMDLPKIPPRPSKRSVDRSISPHRDAFARSPLNDPAFLHKHQHHHKESHLGAELPPRPPSVTLPSIGQEGAEYASFDDLSKTLSNDDQSGSPHHTKNVAGDLPLFAPTASVPSSTAKSRIQTVTRTDSTQAAAAGIGKLAPDERSPLGPDSGRSDSSAGNRTRPASVYREDEKQGIPEIGVQVPMYPDAGDVQAPTPSPYEQSSPLGFSHKPGASSGRHHSRTKSGREIFHGPPGSYGLHGHGVIPKDEFQQQWYAKHPEELSREKAGEYGPHIQVDRKDYHWVGDDLVKLVHSSASKMAGMGTSREAIGTPDEQIGYLATEEYASRMASPKPASGRPASISSKSGVHVDSRLRQESVPEDQLTRTKTRESEADPDVIHIDPPTHRSSSKLGGGEYEAHTEDVGHGGAHNEEEDHWVSGYGAPILAADEVQKHPDAEWRQPAVTPELEGRASAEFTLNELEGLTKARTHSRSSSRNNRTDLHKSSRFASSTDNLDRSGTPLESTREYEPLFPEEEDEEHEKKHKSAVDRLKRPDLARHHFPSQDVWEDTPSSLQLQTTVETPQAPEETYEEQNPADPDVGTVFEKPESEQARKEYITEEDQKSFLPEHTKRFANKHLHKDHLGPTRPGMQQRFPSHDIWEDAPEHGQLVATVSTPQTEVTHEYADDAPVQDKPTIPARPNIPARPRQAEISPTEKKSVPSLPEKPKPSIPARPSRPSTKSSEKVPTVDSQAAEAPQSKPKPPVPVRPGGSKIAALQAGFLKDLNSKLGLGPQAPKPKEPEPEKEEEAPKPLQDARKGRAKGPQRRKPTSSPSPAAAATITAEVAVPREKLEIASVTALWSIDNDGELDVPAARMAEKLQTALKAPEKSSDAAKAEEQPEATEGTDEPPADSNAEPSDPDLIQKVTNFLTGSSEPKAEAEADPTPETEAEPEPVVDAQGGLPLDNKLSVEPSESPESASAPEPVKSELPSTDVGAGAAPPPEPVDMAKMEEGKDAESREIGL